MGAMEETRRVLQDFLAPELRSIPARLDAPEKRTGTVDKKIDDAERRSGCRHDEVMGTLRQAIDLTSIQQRLAKPASQQLAHP